MPQDSVLRLRAPGIEFGRAVRLCIGDASRFRIHGAATDDGLLGARGRGLLDSSRYEDCCPSAPGSRCAGVGDCCPWCIEFCDEGRPGEDRVLYCDWVVCAGEIGRMIDLDMALDRAGDTDRKVLPVGEMLPPRGRYGDRDFGLRV